MVQILCISHEPGHLHQSIAPNLLPERMRGNITSSCLTRTEFGRYINVDNSWKSPAIRLTTRNMSGLAGALRPGSRLKTLDAFNRFILDCRSGIERSPAHWLSSYQIHRIICYLPSPMIFSHCSRSGAEKTDGCYAPMA